MSDRCCNQIGDFHDSDCRNLRTAERDSAGECSVLSAAQPFVRDLAMMGGNLKRETCVGFQVGQCFSSVGGLMLELGIC